MDKQAITTVWAYLQRYDETGQPRYLISAFSIAYALMRQNKKKFKITLYKVDWYYEHGGKSWEGVPFTVTHENVLEFLSYWESMLISWVSANESMYQFFLELSKTNLQKLLVTIGAIENPFERLYGSEEHGRFVLGDDEAEEVSEP